MDRVRREAHHRANFRDRFSSRCAPLKNNRHKFSSAAGDAEIIPSMAARTIAGMISENLELIEEITANSDNISESELVYVSDGSEDGTKGLTENGIEELQSLLADIRTWDGGIPEFLIETQCDPEIIDRIMVDEMKRSL